MFGLEHSKFLRLESPVMLIEGKKKKKKELRSKYLDEQFIITRLLLSLE